MSASQNEVWVLRYSGLQEETVGFEIDPTMIVFKKRVEAVRCFKNTVEALQLKWKGKITNWEGLENLRKLNRTEIIGFRVMPRGGEGAIFVDVRKCLVNNGVEIPQKAIKFPKNGGK